MDLAHHDGPISHLKSKLVWLGIALTILGILAIATPWAAATFVDFMVAGSLLAAGITAATSSILDPAIFAGLLCGAMLPYWFSAMTMKSVATSQAVVNRTALPSCSCSNRASGPAMSRWKTPSGSRGRQPFAS